MARFCTKCGAPVGEGMGFCTSCGATVGAPAAPPAQAPAAPAAPVVAARAAPVAPAPAPAAAPTAKSGSGGLKIVLLILAGLVLFFILGMGYVGYHMYRAYRVGRQVYTQIAKESSSTRPMRAGTPEVSTVPSTPAAPTPPPGPVVDTGVAVYPGATPWGGGGQMSMGVATVKTQQYLTSDSVDQVVAFYKDKLGSNAMVTQSGGQASVQLIGSNGVTTIGITQDSSTGKTKISVSCMTK